MSLRCDFIIFIELFSIDAADKASRGRKPIYVVLRFPMFLHLAHTMSQVMSNMRKFKLLEYAEHTLALRPFLYYYTLGYKY